MTTEKPNPTLPLGDEETVLRARTATEIFDALEVLLDRRYVEQAIAIRDAHVSCERVLARWRAGRHPALRDTVVDPAVVEAHLVRSRAVAALLELEHVARTFRELASSRYGQHHRFASIRDDAGDPCPLEELLPHARPS